MPSQKRVGKLAIMLHSANCQSPKVVAIKQTFVFNCNGHDMNKPPPKIETVAEYMFSLAEWMQILITIVQGWLGFEEEFSSNANACWKLEIPQQRIAALPTPNHIPNSPEKNTSTFHQMKKHVFTVFLFTMSTTLYNNMLEKECVFHCKRSFVNVCLLSLEASVAWTSHIQAVSLESGVRNLPNPPGVVVFRKHVWRRRLFHWNIWDAHGLAGLESTET